MRAHYQPSLLPLLTLPPPPRPSFPVPFHSFFRTGAQAAEENDERVRHSRRLDRSVRQREEEGGEETGAKEQEGESGRGGVKRKGREGEEEWAEGAALFLSLSLFFFLVCLLWAEGAAERSIV